MILSRIGQFPSSGPDMEFVHRCLIQFTKVKLNGRSKSAAEREILVFSFSPEERERKKKEKKKKSEGHRL